MIISKTVIRRILLPMLAVIAVGSLAGCGRNGEPVLPDKKQDGFPAQYPKSTDPQSGVFN
jgi:predicted small lipoprotein YifL